MVVESLLDLDLYKLTMQACIHKHYPDAQVEYLLYNRNADKVLTQEAVEWIREQVRGWKDFRLSSKELSFLRKELSYLPAEYFAFMENFQLDPVNEVDIHYGGGSDLRICVKGAWDVTIWYEVPVLATVSEAYYKFVDTEWNMQGQQDLAAEKARKLVEAGCAFSEFGTRRRRSHEVQKIILEGILQGVNKSPLLLGTSNVHFARLFGLKPIGTVAHELMMGIAAYNNDYASANKKAMEVWLDTVGNANAGVALTDTFGTAQFLKIFVPPFSDVYVGVRQDSGDPKEYTKEISRHFAKLGYKPNTKRIVYSDSLNIERCIELKQFAEECGLLPGFGVGTFFTNDFRRSSDPSVKSEPLNIVMKIAKVNGRPAIKISDNLGKNTGDPVEVQRVKEQLGYEESGRTMDESRRWT